MATATKTRKQAKTYEITLRESATTSTAPHKVDREKGIIFGVKLMGYSSPNTHGINGVTGTDYLLEAVQQYFRPGLEIKANLNHPPRENRTADRKAEERIGKFVVTHVDPQEGPFADFHVLKTHPMANQLFEAAERMPDLFACSPASRGRGEIRNGRNVIVTLLEVKSVDVVADGATTSSLFESQEPIMKKVKVKTYFESLLPKLKEPVRTNLKTLLESEHMPAMCEMDEPAPVAGEPEEKSHEQALRDGFEASVGAIVSQVLGGEMEADAGVKKIKELLTTHSKLSAAPEEPEEEEVEESEEEEDKGKKDDRMEESKNAAEIAKLKAKDMARDLFEAAELSPKKLPTLFESVMLVPEATGKKLIEEYKAGQAAPKKGAPRQSAQGGTLLHESAGGTDSHATFVNRLKRQPARN